jgi:C-terminal processing protease CtpA/Prc
LTIEDRGIQPRILVDPPATAFETRDPIWEKAMEVLRKRVEESTKN